MERTREALKMCAEKIARRGVTRSRLIATQACRAATNGEAFLAEVKRDIGLDFDIISTEEEARLAVIGCADLIDPTVEAVVVFDIGGGSTEVSFLRIAGAREDGSARHELAAWFSMPFGVVNLSERWGGRELSAQTYGEIVEDIAAIIRAEGDPAKIRAAFDNGRAHLLGTSGTVTSIAGVHLGLKRYRRDDVDGLWLSAAQARGVSARLCGMSFEERAAEPCIGEERADLVVCGCAILDALLQVWPADRIRVADRGLREGLLAGMAAADARRRRNSRRRRRGRNSRERSAD
jgi:exopolyphosphatase/guanosine-5'-triphosphate,3'-diphosphate pyrophosphatase